MSTTSDLLPQLGRGTTLAYSLTLGAGATFTPIGLLVSVDGPNTTVGEVETTVLASVIKPYLPTLPETEGTFNIQHNSANAGVIALRQMVKVAPVPIVQFQVTYPDNATDTFTGFAKGYSISGVENETVISAAVPFRATSVVTSVAAVAS